MKYASFSRSLVAVLGVLALSGTAAFADPAPTTGNPDTNASDKNFDTNQPNTIGGAAQKTEDGTNRALNKVDSGVHKAVGGTKKAGRKTKQGAKNAAADVKASANDKIEPVTSTAAPTTAY